MGNPQPQLGEDVIFFTGPEGSGKTLHASRMADTLGLPLVSYGDLVRAKIDKEDPKILDACLRAQQRGSGYLDFDDMRPLIQERLGMLDVRGGVVIEGALRTLKEVKRTPILLRAAGFSNSDVNVVVLRTPVWDSVKRILSPSTTAERRQPRADDIEDKLLERLTSYNLGLGYRTSAARANWGEPIRVVTFRRPPEEVQEEILGKLTRVEVDAA